MKQIQVVGMGLEPTTRFHLHEATRNITTWDETLDVPGYHFDILHLYM